jgi:hypothetical protein
MLTDKLSQALQRRAFQKMISVRHFHWATSTADEILRQIPSLPGRLPFVNSRS